MNTQATSVRRKTVGRGEVESSPMLRFDAQERLGQRWWAEKLATPQYPNKGYLSQKYLGMYGAPEWSRPPAVADTSPYTVFRFNLPLFVNKI